VQSKKANPKERSLRQLYRRFNAEYLNRSGDHPVFTLRMDRGTGRAGRCIDHYRYIRLNLSVYRAFIFFGDLLGLASSTVLVRRAEVVLD
jgi:hypothetical protein